MNLRTDLNEEEFLSLLLIHAAYADLEFTEEERNVITKFITEEEFEVLHEAYKKTGDYEILDIILSYKGLYYPTVAQKDDIMHNVKILFESDDDYSIIEQSLYNFLEKLL